VSTAIAAGQSSVAGCQIPAAQKMRWVPAHSTLRLLLPGAEPGRRKNSVSGSRQRWPAGRLSARSRWNERPPGSNGRSPQRSSTWRVAPSS